MFLFQREYHSIKEICAEIVNREKYSVKIFYFHSDHLKIITLIIPLFFNSIFIYYVRNCL